MATAADKVMGRCREALAWSSGARVRPRKENRMTETEKKAHHALTDWIGDIVALESHVEEAMDRQLKLTSDNATLTAAIKRYHDTVRDSKQRAVQYQEQYGSEPGNPIIKAG